MSIAYALVRVVSMFNANPIETHFTAAKIILRYLQGTISLALRYKKESNSLIGYSDVD